MTHNKKGAEISAIEFALRADDGIEFLRAWHEGSFDVVRREWPDAPAAVFVGADPLHKPKTPEQSEPIKHKHEWFRTNAMEPGVCRCIHCGEWSKEDTHPAPKAEQVQPAKLTDKDKAVADALDNLLYWVGRAVGKGNANSDIEEAMRQYNQARAAQGVKK